MQALRRLRRDAMFHLTGVSLSNILIDPENLGEEKNQVAVTMNQGPGQLPGNRGEANTLDFIPADQLD